MSAGARREPAAQAEEDRRVAELVSVIQDERNGEAFSELYRIYFDRVYGYLRLVLRDEHEAEDAAQQVFVNVLKGLRDYVPRRPFRAWLFTIVRNLALNRVRDRARVDVLDPDAVDREASPARIEEPELPSLEWISDRDLLMLINRLPTSQRQVLTMRYLLDLNAGEIAEVMDRTPEDVRMLQHRAHRFLRERLSALGRAPERRGRARMRTRLREATILRARRFSIVR
ncbi:MAG: RNA polymerase sigma factor [Solirubrobacterales bacterium]